MWAHQLGPRLQGEVCYFGQSKACLQSRSTLTHHAKSSARCLARRPSFPRRSRPMTERRHFLKTAALGALASGLGGLGL
ncbi:twin-arginine translocation signal domain-containing protein, partial [Xanthomonas sp. Kuri4-1]